MKLTKDTAPNFFKVVDSMCEQLGTGPLTACEVEVQDLPTMEVALGALTAEEVEMFASADEEAITVVLGRHWGLAEASRILDKVWESLR